MTMCISWIYPILMACVLACNAAWIQQFESSGVNNQQSKDTKSGKGWVFPGPTPGNGYNSFDKQIMPIIFPNATDRNSSQYSPMKGSSNEALYFGLSDELITTPPVTIEVRGGSEPWATPGQTRTINFIVTNTLDTSYSLAFRLSSTSSTNAKPVRVYPVSANAQPNVPINVEAEISVSSTAQIGKLETVTLTITQQQFSFNSYQYTKSVNERAVSFRVGNKPEDNSSPSCSTTIVSNCDGYTDSGSCLNRVWNAEATFRDTETGLRHIWTVPDRLSQNWDFTVGTFSPVPVTFSDTCCNPQVNIYGEDLAQHKTTCTIKVNSSSSAQLQSGEIAAIVLGCILFIILVAVIVFFVVKKRKEQKMKKLFQQTPRRLSSS